MATKPLYQAYQEVRVGLNAGNVFATQFHPEKSGKAGLLVLDAFLKARPQLPVPRNLVYKPPPDMLSKRIIACLDVRTNDQGDLVVTKGDQYDVREKEGDVRNLGKPVELASRYYQDGADEITFLNITSFRDFVIEDNLMLQVLKKTSESVFVPLTIGGGIRDLQRPDGTIVPAVEVAGEYFRSGADKVSLGSDAVYIAERYQLEKNFPNAITAISNVYGAQAVVISVDPKRVYVSSPEETKHFTVKTKKLGPSGEQFWFIDINLVGTNAL
jgi:glutamine amidotransferase/cyclase